MSSSPRRGLPARRQMRHDAHYVDAIAHTFDDPVGRMIPLAEIEPNPYQPRVQMGELAELVSSIEERGVLEPLIVRAAEGGGYQLVSGERRMRAAQAAGLTRVPCVEIDVDDAEALEVALVENLVRRDLTPFEEADGLLALRESFGYKHADLSGKLGRSRSAVTELLSIAAIPEPVRDLCIKKDVLAKSQLVQVARAGDRAKMEATVLRIAEGGLSRDEVAAARREDEGKPKKGRPKHYAFKWQAPEKSFAVQIRFRKTRVSKAEVLSAVRSLLEQLEEE